MVEAETTDRLKVAGQFDCAMQLAPDLNNQGCWLQRPLTCSDALALQDADSVYTRDLAVAPVKTLQRPPHQRWAISP